MTQELLLQKRAVAKKRKPTFVVKESKFSARVKSRWRFPRGKHSKVRQMHKGRPPLPGPGYGSPPSVRGLHSSGLEMVLVHNAAQVESLNPATQGAIVAAGVGNKKRLDLLTAAVHKKITILNIKDTAKYMEEIKKDFEQRKKARRDKSAAVSKKEEEKKKKAEEKKKKEESKEKSSEEEKQKEMIEKTITKRQ